MIESQLSPIILFVYNRPAHTLQTLEALANNKLANQSILYIYADGVKDGANSDTIAQINEVRKIIRQKQWCREVHLVESEKNKGLADSIVGGVTDIINRYGRAIILEDDIVASPLFLEYMNTALDLYEETERVMHIASYMPLTSGAERLPDTYFLRFMSCWGWATWKRAWNELITDIEFLHKILPPRLDFKDFDLDNTINQFSQIERNYNGTMKTWAIKWYATIFLKQGLCLYPKYSLVKNIGMDNSGHNTQAFDDSFDVSLSHQVKIARIRVNESKYARDYLKRFYIYGKDSSCKKRIVRYLKSTRIHRIYIRIRYGIK